MDRVRVGVRVKAGLGLQGWSNRARVSVTVQEAHLQERDVLEGEDADRLGKLSVGRTGVVPHLGGE